MKLIKINKDLVIRLFHYVNNIRNSEVDFRGVFNNCPRYVESCRCCSYEHPCSCVGVAVSEINLNK